MVTRARRTLGLSALLVLTFGACGDDPVAPVAPEDITRVDITHSFAATTLTVRVGGTTVNLLWIGARLEVTLNEDSTTTGRLFVPGLAEDGWDFDANLLGTFSFDDSTDEVTFAHAANTFLQDVTFTASRAGGVVQLEAEETSGSTTVHVVLR